MKQRLIGGAVLVALAVLLLPVFFDGAGVEQEPTVEFTIPPRPDLEPAPPLEPARLPPLVEALPEPEPEPAPKPKQGAEPTVAPRASAQPVATEEANPVEDDGGLSAWVIQLGSFQRESNALGLRESLRKAGFAAFIIPADDDGTPSYRVRVGPEQTRARAEDLQKRLAKAGHQGLLLRHR